MAAEVGAGAVPKCHKAALLPFPRGTKGLLCPPAWQQQQCPPPGCPLEPEPGPRQDTPITGFLQGAQPPHLLHTHLHQHLGSNSAKARYSTQA